MFVLLLVRVSLLSSPAGAYRTQPFARIDLPCMLLMFIYVCHVPARSKHVDTLVTPAHS